MSRRAARREAALAGHLDDEPTARRLCADADPEVRTLALSALVRMGASTPDDIARSLADTDPAVRRRACELAPGVPGATVGAALEDSDTSVVEAAAWALGEQQATAAVIDLARVAREHDDPLCREAAVAALGAIGDRAGLPAILAATHDRPAVRRRAVIALAPFDGPEVEEALQRALADRDWQVRQAAEDLSED
jgi:HEAT repeat protein